MAVTASEIERIALLAAVALDEETARELEDQLSRILDYVAQLAAVPGLAETPDDPGAAALRPDRVGSDPLALGPQHLAPAFKERLFLVPRLEALSREEEAHE